MNEIKKHQSKNRALFIKYRNDGHKTAQQSADRFCCNSIILKSIY